MDDFIVFKNLHKSFGAKQVLKGVDLSIRKGETVVILGGSGSGKSVLIRHTIGLHRPDAGEVWVDGVEISGFDEDDLMPVRTKVGMLFQGGALFDSMDVFENIAFGLREHTEMNEEQIAARVAEVLDLVELGDIEELAPSDLSGGMRKRVALARAIALSPEGILYDEPTTGLDPILADAINRLIINLQRALNATSVVVTHDIQSAFTVGDRIAFLLEGRLEFVGSVD
ncbi:MAG TPA: ABC transporter ATP-binding protein, partial [Patescibacteria group bacterium]|nr:ABC transporter ATP-binding protein [Patescibacteria group bacterium]